MPSAAMHHAGVHWRQLEALEAALKEDVRSEAVKWGGRLLLHQEFAAGDLSKRGSAAGREGSTGGGGGNGTPGGAAAASPRGARANLLPLLGGSFLTPPDNPGTPQVAGLRTVFASPSFAQHAGSRAGADASGVFGAGFSAAAAPPVSPAAMPAPSGDISSAAVAAAAAQIAAASAGATPEAATP
jgi:hypothetical protein